MHGRKSIRFKDIFHPKLLVTKMAQPERSEKNMTKVTLKVAWIFGQLRWFVLVRITNVLRLERPRVETQVQWTHVRYLTAKPVRYHVDRLLIGLETSLDSSIGKKCGSSTWCPESGERLVMAANGFLPLALSLSFLWSGFSSLKAWQWTWRRVFVILLGRMVVALPFSPTILFLSLSALVTIVLVLLTWLLLHFLKPHYYKL